MRRASPSDHPAEYFFRCSPEAPERGPFTLENLCDLAEFRHLTEQSLIRARGEEKSRPLREVPELLSAVFPPKRKLAARRPKRGQDAGARQSSVNADCSYCCAAQNISPLASGPASANSTDQLGGRELAGGSLGFNPKRLLEESSLQARARRAAQTAEPNTLRYFSFRDSILLLRWGLALLLVACAFWLWSTVWGGANIFLALLLGMVPMCGAILLTVNDIIAWTLDALERFLVGLPPKPADYGEAEAHAESGDWAAATSAYLRIIEHDPYQVRAYREGIAAAVAADSVTSVAAFHNLALRHLGVHDQNLLAGALLRHGLPPLPRPLKTSGTPKMPKFLRRS